MVEIGSGAKRDGRYIAGRFTEAGEEHTGG